MQHRSKDIKHATWHRDVTDIEKKQRWLSKQQHSNFGAEYNHDQESKHDHAIHVVKVDMTRIPTIYCMHQ